VTIAKTASDTVRFRRDDLYYSWAREAMYDLLRSMIDAGMIDTVLVPAYVGWSSREGSGIYDPLMRLTDLEVSFYAMTEDLQIDAEDLGARMAQCASGRFAVLIVNYFGFYDRRIEGIVRSIRDASGWIIEDNAHGFFTHVLGDKTYSDATFFSLHKMFPFSSGGSLVASHDELRSLPLQGFTRPQAGFNPWEYDIAAIARVRRQNYARLEELVGEQGASGRLAALMPGLPDGIVPQTFPVVILNGSRDAIYEEMNAAGYGVVSLYHTMIEPLRVPEYRASAALSRRILNLPVHQDVAADEYAAMMKLLVELCERTS